jgi:hypothetical protein
MGIRRWLSGTLRPDRLETDSLEAVTLEDGVAGSNNSIDRLMGAHLDRKSVTSDQTSVDFVDVFSASDPYSVYILDIAAMSLTNNDTFNLVVSTDGGSTWETGSSSYKWAYRTVSESASTGGLGSGTGDTHIELSNTVRNSDDNAVKGRLRFYSPTDTDTEPLIEYSLTRRNGGNDAMVNVKGSGQFLSTNAVDSFRIISENDVAIDLFKGTLKGGMR